MAFPTGALAGLALGAALVHHLGPGRVLFVLGAVAGAVLGGIVSRSFVGDHHRPDDGRATASDERTTMSLGAVRAMAEWTRPSMTKKERNRAPGQAVGISLGRSTRGVRRQLFASLEDIVLLVAPPRMGKTTHLRKVVVDAPGACVATSTKTDIFEWTEAERRAGGSEVYVFNPERIGRNVPNTFCWNPVGGCQHPQVAIDRASYFLSGSSISAGSNDRDFWDGSNFRALRCLLHAAALGQKTIVDVARWCGPSGKRKEALDILDRHVTPLTADWADDLRDILALPERTRESLFAGLALTFEFVKNPAVRDAVVPKKGQPSFSVRRFIESRGTLYLLGSERPRGGLSPLFTAFTGHLFETAKVMSSREEGGRLDPPLLLALDEAALICPVPLERWTADASGRGIPMVLALQSPSQLYDRWGQDAGETIWTNSTVKMVLGGLSVAKHLRDLEELCGKRTVIKKSYTTGADGKRSETRTMVEEPAFPADKIRSLGKREVLVLHRNTKPLLAKIAPLPRRKKTLTQTELVPEARPAPRPPAVRRRLPVEPQRAPAPAAPNPEQPALAPVVPMRPLRKVPQTLPAPQRRRFVAEVEEADPVG